jgi:3-oxoacyl-[acyl-carrier protein] reductase
MKELKDRTIIVTGATRGIGRAIAACLVERGATVVGTGTRETESRMRGEAGLDGVVWWDLDLADSASLDAFLEGLAELGKIDGLINNAGINRIKPIADVSTEDYEDVLSINLKAPYFLCKSIGSAMAEQGGGSILNIASIWSVVTKPQRTLYTTAKAGLAGLTRALAAELGPSGVLVNTLSPGFTLTDLTRESLSDEEMKGLCDQIPLRKMADPEDIAKVAAFLVGPDNRYITGQNIVADGGFTIV